MTSTSTLPALQQEWITLQNNYERYEKLALLIKLAGFACFIAALAWSLYLPLTLLALLGLWLQEAIYRTFQARLGARIIKVEAALRLDSDIEAFQLHSEWQAGRKGTAGMLAEYASHALRPTIAFPYVLLVLAQLAMVFMQAGQPQY
jgi:hypothetical protein